MQPLMGRTGTMFQTRSPPSHSTKEGIMDMLTAFAIMAGLGPRGVDSRYHIDGVQQ